MLIDSDSAQIGARVLAWWLANQCDLTEAFAKGEDVYKIMASAIYSKASTEITKEERFVGKTTILGSGYGMGAKKFQAQLKGFGVEISEQKASRIIAVYRGTYSLITELWRQGQAAIEAMAGNQSVPFCNGAVVVHGRDGILMPNSMFQRYPNLRKVLDEQGKEQYMYDACRGVNKIYGGKLVENIWLGRLGPYVVSTTGDAIRETHTRYKEIHAYVSDYQVNDWRALADSHWEFPPSTQELIICDPEEGITAREVKALTNWLRA